MARDTDRKHVSEAVRLTNGKWRIESVDNEVYPGGGSITLARFVNGHRAESGEQLFLRYGRAGQIVRADHQWPGICNGIITNKRQRVLDIIGRNGRNA